MKKKLCMFLAMVFVVASFAGCGSSSSSSASATDDGTVFNIYAWNEEYKGFFEKYYADQIPEGVEVKWTIVPSDDGAYQEALDAALLNQESADPADKVDMFLAEADYIKKYTDSDTTMDVAELGVEDFSNTYQYTVDTASDANGTVKGVSFQCCPSGLIYRRSIAKEVLGTDDPAEVQAALDSWEKFDAVAADAKAKGYLMTPSYAETYRTFSNNTEGPWVDADNNVIMDDAILTWMDQAENYVKNGYTLTEGIWDAGKNAEMGKNGKAMCFFGPAWYFNFCMGPAHDEAMGDWGLVQGPQAHYWGGTWLMAAAGTDNASIVGDCMNAFINDEAVCENLIRNEAQFTNNKAVNAKVAEDPEYASEFLGGQNDVAVFAAMADGIDTSNMTYYDQYLNEGLQTYFVEYLKGSVDSRDAALANFYKYVNEKCPELVTPDAQ